MGSKDGRKEGGGVSLNVSPAGWCWNGTVRASSEVAARKKKKKKRAQVQTGPRLVFFSVGAAIKLLLHRPF